MEEAVSKSHGKEIILLVFTLLTLLILGEVFFRLYYWWLDKPVAVDSNELCFKEMKSPKNYVSVSPNNFLYSQEWDDHPLMGRVPMKNYSGADKTMFLQVRGLQVKGGTLNEATHHNSQGLTNVEEFSIKKPENVKLRIALFGDSFTCGSEAPLKLNTASILKELVPQSEVLNFCVLGSGIDTMYARYVIEGKKYLPDVVVFNVFVDDVRRAFDCELFRPNLSISDGHIFIGPRKWSSMRDFYFGYVPLKYESYLFKHIKWVYNERTRVKRDFEQGLQLFSVMLDDLKKQTEEVTFIVVPIIHETANDYEVETYKKIIDLLKSKNITFFDSKEYFNSVKKKYYRNQSFYYSEDTDAFSHFSPVGNALFAQKLKNVLEEKGIIQPTPNYFVANFDRTGFLYLIPEDLLLQMAGEVRVIASFDRDEPGYKGSFNLKRVDTIPSS